MASKPRPTHHGIRVRHSLHCRSHDNAACNCDPGYEAWAYIARERRKVRKSFPTLAAARAWRADAQSAIRRGKLHGPTSHTLQQIAEEFIEQARQGAALTRSGHTYKPSAIRSYEAALANTLLPQFGDRKLEQIHRADIQQLVDMLVREGRSGSSIRNTLMPLRVIYRRAIQRGHVGDNPTTYLDLPANNGRRDRIATPAEATLLLNALRTSDRALWATALYAGLRRGELQALHWQQINLATGLIRVERSWDDKEHAYITPKSRAGSRTVPIPAALRDHLTEHKMSWPDGLAFGATPERPFVATTIQRRAHTAWTKAQLKPIGLHEARHTYASLMLAAGTNPKTLSTYMGHASITTTLDRYIHLLPDETTQTAQRLDNYLAQTIKSHSASV